MSGEKLGKVRKKLEEVTSLIEDADQKKIDCKHATVEAFALLEKHEVELQSSKRRIVLIQKDLEAAKDRLVKGEEKLGKATESSEEVEKSREDLEAGESATDERIQNEEAQIKEMRRNVELNETKVGDGERKAIVCQNDIARIKEKSEGAEKRVATLEGTIQNHGKSLSELEEREGESGDREQLNEEKMVFLERELKETAVRAEAAERNNAVLNNNMLETENEINGWVKKREEIESQIILMDDVADDPAYMFVSAFGHGDSDSGRTTPVSMEDKMAMFGKMREGGEDEQSSRTSSRMEDRPEDAEPAPEPAAPEPVRAPAPAPVSKEEEESEEESGEEDW